MFLFLMKHSELQNYLIWSHWRFSCDLVLRTVRTWDLTSEKKHKSVFKPRSLQGKRVTPTCCTYSRDGKLIAAGCQDGTIQIWDRNLSVSVSLPVVCGSVLIFIISLSKMSNKDLLFSVMPDLACRSLDVWPSRMRGVGGHQSADTDQVFGVYCGSGL